MQQAGSHIWPGVDGAGRTCVFKRVRPEDAQREDLVLRLHNEALVLQYLVGTPGVIQLLDVQHDPLTLVLEFADGGSLAARLDGRLRGDQGIAIARELIDAVAACHDRGVVHRDIKPSNLLFVGGELRLADFGVAAWGDPRQALPDGWEEGEVGTPPWSAPELRVNATGQTATAIDVYGVAMTLGTLVRDASGTIAAALSQDPRARPTLEELGRALA